MGVKKESNKEVNSFFKNVPGAKQAQLTGVEAARKRDTLGLTACFNRSIDIALAVRCQSNGRRRANMEQQIECQDKEGTLDKWQPK
jgi:hypothetical protein